MKATELRIGNYILNNGKIVEVDYLTPTSIGYDNGKFSSFNSAVMHYEPIQLTEEWLLKLGFELCFQTCYRGRYSNFRINGIWVYFFCDTNTVEFRDSDFIIDYVHQLQNLYFALTGEELTINENNA